MIKNPALKELTDYDLITLSKDGDQFAFKEIVRRYKAKIATIIYSMIGNCDEADDIGQEVFIRFYRAIDSFRGDSSLGTYLVRIAMNLSLNELKRRKRRNFFSFDKILEEGLDVEDKETSSMFKEEREIVMLTLNKLKPNDKSVIVLRLIDGYSTEEAAEVLGIPVGTVLSRLARAQVKLKKYLLPYLSE